MQLILLHWDAKVIALHTYSWLCMYVHVITCQCLISSIWLMSHQSICIVYTVPTLGAGQLTTGQCNYTTSHLNRILFPLLMYFYFMLFCFILYTLLVLLVAVLVTTIYKLYITLLYIYSFVLFGLIFRWGFCMDTRWIVSIT